MNELNPLDQKVLEFMLNRDDPLCGQLRNQLPFLKGVSRQLTGSGYYTKFEAGNEAKPAIGLVNAEISDVSGSTPDLVHGVGFVLFVRNGFIHMLEGFAEGDEDWPVNEGNIQVHNTQFALDDLK